MHVAQSMFHATHELAKQNREDESFEKGSRITYGYSKDHRGDLKQMIVGRPEGTNIPAHEPVWWYDRPEGAYPPGPFAPRRRRR